MDILLQWVCEHFEAYPCSALVLEAAFRPDSGAELLHWLRCLPRCGGRGRACHACTP